MRPEVLAGMSKSCCWAIDLVVVTPLIVTLQKTWLSGYLPLVRFRNLNIITFCAAGMLVESQNVVVELGAVGPAWEPQAARVVAIVSSAAMRVVVSAGIWVSSLVRNAGLRDARNP